MSDSTFVKVSDVMTASARVIDRSATVERRRASHALPMAMPCSVCPQWSRTVTPSAPGAQSTTSAVSGSPAEEAARRGAAAVTPVFFSAR